MCIYRSNYISSSDTGLTIVTYRMLFECVITVLWYNTKKMSLPSILETPILVSPNVDDMPDEDTHTLIRIYQISWIALQENMVLIMI
jgi:hypothetical protein